jgi:hypothetical protein
MTRMLIIYTTALARTLPSARDFCIAILNYHIRRMLRTQSLCVPGFRMAFYAGQSREGYYKARGKQLDRLETLLYILALNRLDLSDNRYLKETRFFISQLSVLSLLSWKISNPPLTDPIPTSPHCGNTNIP